MSQEPLMVTFYVSRKNGEVGLIEKLDRIAASWKRSRSYVIMRAIQKFIEEEEKKSTGGRQCVCRS